jgi:NAD(P)H-flavin reductase
MFIIYAAAFDNVKNTKFEYFWYTHHLFTAFFVLCLMHGRGYWSPNFWKWFLVPGVLYGLERLFRFLKSRKPVSLLSVTMMRPNVISLEFEKAGPFKDGYQEGQYVFLKCPAISEHQWHPFTISSAPCEPTVTLHIRTWGEKSWTKKMADYMSSMMPVNATFTRFSHMSGTGNMAGKTTGPDGQPLFNIDGPHAAPTQHAKEYSTVMLVGGGIGVTPLASSMKEIIFKTWKYSIGQSYPDKAYFYWMVAHNELDSFRWFMRTIKECDDEFCDLSAKNQSMQSKSFEFHIFVTSAPQARDPSMVKITEAPRADDEDHAIWGRHVRREVSGDQMIRTEQSIGSGYTELDMFRACKLLNSKDDGPISLGLVKHVKVWNGRPQWDKHFSTVVSGTPSGEIGVAVCANPTICNDLEKFCAQYSSPADNRFVILHKENF